MIRQATIEDISWMAEKSLPKFSLIYSKDECPTIEKLKEHFKNHIIRQNMSFVTETKTAFIIISHSFSNNMIVQKIDFWFSEIYGHGIILWDFVCDLAKRHKMPQLGIIHNIEKSLIKFSIRKGFFISNFGDGFKLANKVNI